MRSAASSSALPPARVLAERIARRELSSTEVVEACLARIEARDGDVRAWSFVDAGAARAQARARDEEPPRGPLHGIPVGIKDIIDTADMPTELGSPIHRGRRPSADAACVERLRAAGAVILGKTATTEFATWTPAATRNPHALDRTPGGSSSGSAAAVADGMVPLALGTQTVGSTIRPAAFCGVAALKPTHDAARLDGVLLHSPQLDTLGLMAVDAEDLPVLWRALRDTPGPEAEPAAAARVALVRTPWWDRADAASRAAVDAAADALRGRGAVVDERPLPARFPELLAAHQTVTVHDLARGLAVHRDDLRLSAQLRDLVEQGSAVTGAAYDEALRTREQVGAELAQLWDAYDALLVPAVTGEAPPLAGGTGDAVFCQPWSLLGTPAVTVPAGAGPTGLPIGVQLVASRGRDLPLLDIARLASPAP
jgi:Asp-tRNA(Asn)/Glu-tRNA(Gln) amidotransferase A subunit family amidase